ncbi:MAG: putative holin-like toxin [Bacillota bacterium]
MIKMTDSIATKRSRSLDIRFQFIKYSVLIKQEVMPVEVKDTLMLMIQFATLVILIISFNKKK